MSLSMMSAYMMSYEKELNVTHHDFWSAMSYFLYRRNHKIYLDRDRKNKAKNKGR